MVDAKLEPMPLWQSCLLFLGLGGVAFLLSTVGVPWVTRTFEISQTSSMMGTGALLFAVLTIVAAAMYSHEGRSFTWSEIKDRLRIRNISRKDWLLVLLGVLIVDATYIGLQFTAKPIAGLFPAWLSDPYRMDTTLDQSGDYLGLVLFTGLILFNVVSEEVLWRGYALPRQELTHGRDTWWIHGLLWTGFHWFKPWDLIALLPGALVYGWLSTRTKSMIPGLVLHIGLNGLGILLMALRVFG